MKRAAARLPFTLCAVPLSLMLAACSHNAAHAPKVATRAEVAPPRHPTFPPSPDVSREVMGWTVLTDGARVLRELTPPGQPTDLQTMQMQTAKSAGLDPILGEVLDLRRPAAVAILNPMLLAQRGVRPFLAMLPVKSGPNGGRAQVEQALKARGAQLEPQPWGFALDSAQGKIYVGFSDDYAVVAWRADLLDAAEKLLAPKLAQKAEAPILVHVSMDNLYSAFGPQLDAMMGHFARAAAQGGPSADPGVAFALRDVKQILRYADSLSALELLLNLDSGGLTVTARLDGKPNGTFTGYVQQQETGPAWGVQYLPRDSVLVYTTHSNAKSRADEVNAQLAFFAGSGTRVPKNEDLARWHRAMDRAASATNGELAYAVWPGQTGGVGVGGAYRVTDPAMAKESIMGVYNELAPQLGPMVVRALSLDADKLGEKFTVKRKQALIVNTEVEMVELTPRWPDASANEKRLFESMFGPKLVLATAFVGDQALFTLGRDWAPRLETMLRTAQGERSASLADEPDFAEAVQFHGGKRVSMSYLETGRMAHFAAGLLAQANDLAPEQRAAIDAILQQVGRGAIITTTNASGRRYELTTHVPRSAIVGAARLNGALWRVALSPLVNPPMMPPMPVPPPHVAPSVNLPGNDGPTM